MLTIRPEQQATLLGLPHDPDGLVICIVPEETACSENEKASGPLLAVPAFPAT